MWNVKLLAIYGFYASNIAIIIYSLTVAPKLLEYYVYPLFLLECFIILGFVTSDFLSPSLSVISNDILHISERVSGMTLLALGNSIPDVTSTYESMKTGATSLAIGELLGGVFFLVTVVIGLMGLVRTIHLNDLEETDYDSESLNGEFVEENTLSVEYSRKHYMIDITLFLILISLTLYVLIDGQLTFIDCGILITTYLIYVFYQLREHANENIVESLPDSVLNNTTGQRSTDIVSIIKNSTPTDPNFSLTKFDRGTKKRRGIIKRRIQHYMRNNYHGWVRMTLKDCVDIWDNDEILHVNKPKDNSQNDEAFETTSLLNVPTSMHHALDLSDDIPSFNVITEENENNEEDQFESEISRDETPLYPNTSDSRIPFHFSLNRPITQKSLSCNHLPNLYTSLSPVGALDQIQEEEPLLGSASSNVSKTYSFSGNELFHKLLICTVQDGACEFLALLFTAPSSFLMNICIPTPDNLKHNGNFHLLSLFQFAMSPIILSVLLFEDVTIWSILVAVVVSTIAVYRYVKNIVTYNHQLVSIVEFLTSLAVTSKTVKLIVNILINWTEQYNFSATLLGLTIFAWGNSIGDLVSNITFMQIGVVDIALCACFGSPLMSFVFGIGVDGILIMAANSHAVKQSLFKNPIVFEIDTHMLYTSYGTLLALVVLMLAVPLNGWKIDFRISGLLLLIYTFVTILNIYIKLR